MSETLYVCSTCDRYHPSSAGAPSMGAALKASLMSCGHNGGALITIRGVECLNGCPRPCNAALRAPGKAVIRFFKLVPEDASDVLTMACLYAESKNGCISLEAIPVRLRNRVTQSMVRIPTPGIEEDLRRNGNICA